MSYVFGPVPSRRLGKSLGIDPVPLKTCNWNCVYCQLGRTRPLTNQRREYIPCQDLLAEIGQVLSDHQPGEIDWVTFVGSGEPTLHSSLGWLIRRVKQICSLPVAVITNGSTLYLPEIRLALSDADAVLPSLDAGNPRLYRKVNRPWPELTFNRLLEGLIAFRQEYTGKLWLEMMLVQGLNDTEEALTEIASAICRIQPDRLHINLPVRPPAEAWVCLPGESSLQRAQAILGTIADIVLPALSQPVTCYPADLESTILGIITRHPMQETELCSMVGRWTPVDVHEALDALRTSQKVCLIERYGKQFWSAASASYA